MPRKYNKSAVATLRKKVRAKGKTLGSDGVVSYNAAQSRYKRALQRGKDVNGNLVPQGLKGEAKIEWAKSVENTKRAKKGAEKAVGLTSAKKGALRKAESRRQANIKEVKELYIGKAESASKANKQLVSKLKQRLDASPGDKRSQRLYKKYKDRQVGLDSDLALKKKVVNGFDTFDNAQAIEAKKLLKSEFSRAATPSSLKQDASSIIEMKKGEALANQLKYKYKGKVKDISLGVYRQLGIKTAVQRTEIHRLEDIKIMLKNDYYPKSRFDKQMFKSHATGGGHLQMKPPSPGSKRGLIAAPRPLPSNRREALQQLKEISPKVERRAKEIQSLKKRILDAPRIDYVKGPKKVTSGTSGHRKEIPFSDFFTGENKQGSIPDPASWDNIFG